ncbi:MAG TPA: hypothetical protein VHF45_12415 [Thermoleophilaceae bacterium]|nr:hypothetical protein [Thermoleophilaceae bacterium]
MGVFSWIRRVIADRGEHDPVPIHLERTSHDSYAFRLGIRAGFGGGETARIPVGRRVNPAPHPILKEIHHCEVAGQTLEAANVHALKAKVERLLETIAPGRTLPLCYFRAPAMDYELPVFEHGGWLTTPVLGGPRLRAHDLAGIRRQVCRYLESAGYVGHADEVTVGVVRPRDLRRVAPAAVFRSHTDPQLWIPSVDGVSPDGPVIGVVGHAPELRRRERRRVGAGPRVEDTAPAAPDVVALIRYLQTELGSAARVAAWGLYASEVRPEIWAAAEARTEEAGTRLVAHLTGDQPTRLELAVRRTGAGDVATALEDHGINVFLAPDEDALATQVGHHLAQAEFLRSPAEVEIHHADAPRAERLGVDSIRAPEEVHASWS